MAGFRDFQTGEVLTAANVNDFLMQQSVMKFADAAARDTALGTATGGSNALREGMVAYLDDTDEVLAYDGTSWGSLGLPLGTATPTDGQILAFGTATSTWNPTDQLAGIGSNVVQTVKSDVFVLTSTSFQNVTGLSATITPTSDTSKVLVLVSVATDYDDDSAPARAGDLGLLRGATTLAEPFGQVSQRRSDNSAEPQTVIYLDSPNTESATTYQVTARSGSGSTAIYVNRSRDDAVVEGISSITLIEVSA